MWASKMLDILTSKDFIAYVSAFKAHLAQQGRSTATIASYSSDVRLFLQFMQTQQLTSEDLHTQTLIAYRDCLHAKGALQDNSWRRKVISIRQFFAFLTANNELPDNPFVRAIIPDRDDALRYELDSTQLNQLLIGLRTRQDAPSVRNHAIIQLLAFEGLKATELTALRWYDFVASRRSALLRISGNRPRSITLQPASTQSLHTWQLCAQPQDGERLIFAGFKGPEGALPLATLTRHGLKFLLAQLAAKAGLASLSPELLRHHAIRYLLQQGKSIEASMQHLGLKRSGNIRKHFKQMHA